MLEDSAAGVAGHLGPGKLWSMRASSILLSGLLLSACDSTAPGSIEDGPVTLSRLNTQPTAYHDNTTLENAEVGVVLSQAGWDVLYSRIFGNADTVPTEGPSLSFRDSTLIYVGIGFFPSATHSVLLDSAEVDEGTLYVHYTERRAEGCLVPGISVAPVDVAQIPRWRGEVSFVRRIQDDSCS
jgi:hypothetical protein